MVDGLRARGKTVVLVTHALHLRESLLLYSCPKRLRTALTTSLLLGSAPGRLHLHAG